MDRTAGAKDLGGPATRFCDPSPPCPEDPAVLSGAVTLRTPTVSPEPRRSSAVVSTVRRGSPPRSSSTALSTPTLRNSAAAKPPEAGRSTTSCWSSCCMRSSCCSAVSSTGPASASLRRMLLSLRRSIMASYGRLGLITRGAAETQRTSRGSNFSSLCILSHTFVAVGSLNHNPSGFGCGFQQPILWMSHVVYCYPSAVLHISFQN